ncbi:hypothetical protein ACHAW6_003467 [Cyclotella cf. meneghiniana]
MGATEPPPPKLSRQNGLLYCLNPCCLEEGRTTGKFFQVHRYSRLSRGSTPTATADMIIIASSISFGWVNKPTPPQLLLHLSSMMFS